MGKSFCLIRNQSFKEIKKLIYKKITRKTKNKKYLKIIKTKIYKKYLNGDIKEFKTFRYIANSGGVKKLKLTTRDPLYKERKCYDGYKCKKANCHFYHSASSKRINVLLNSLKKALIKDEYEQRLLQSNKIVRNNKTRKFLNFSKFILPLTQFDENDIKDFSKMLLIYLEKIKMKESLYPVKINFKQTRSQLVCERKSILIEYLKKIPIFLFKSKQFCYEKNTQKHQLSFEINDSSVISFVCQDMVDQQPHNLKIIIKSIDNKWRQFQKLIQSIKLLKNVLLKLDLDIREFLGDVEVDEFLSVLSHTFLSLKNLKVINLRLEFNVLKEKGTYERQITDGVLGILKKMYDHSQKNLIIQINIFSIVIQKKQYSLSISKEAQQIDKKHKRNKANKIFKYTNLHIYFINKFNEIFNNIQIDYFNIDFSSLFFSFVSGQEYKTDYEYELKKLLIVLTNLTETLPNSSIEKLRVKFFGFLFQFENQDQTKTIKNIFRMHTQMRNINIPIILFEPFEKFMNTLIIKLKKRYDFQIYEGNLFTSKNYKKSENLNDKKLDIINTIDKASQFQQKITDNYKNLVQINCPYTDLFHAQKILIQKRELIQIIFYRNKRGHYIQNKIIEANKIMYNLKRRLIFSLYAMKKIQKRNNTFQFREEIIKEILKFNNLYPTNTNINENKEIIKFQ